MSTITTVSKTNEQIVAEFAAAFQGVKPDRREADLERLVPYRAEIGKLRRRGLTWKQIADGMRRPPINVAVTEQLLKSVFAPAPKPVPAPASLAAGLRPARLVLDPATGLPKPPKAAGK
ncbi:MAG TPA: hypothetical protein VHE61_00065 [Opitutaceae bacterium]|nr:hypothetical protein [Opitutaceae bacterium]